MTRGDEHVQALLHTSKLADRFTWAEAGWFKWREWHACEYAYDRVLDEDMGIDLLMLRPNTQPNLNVWVGDDHKGFIASLQDGIFELFALDVSTSGRRYVVRPGVPNAVTLYRIPLYGDRVTIGRGP